MTTITAVPDTASASVQLSIPYTSAITRVLRSDANGIAEVRTLAGQLPTGASGTLVLSDYEAAAGLNSYNAYVDEYIVRTNVVTNPSCTTTAGYGLNLGGGTATLATVSGATRLTWSTDATATGGVNAATTLMPGTYVAGDVYTVSADVSVSRDQVIQFGGYYKMGSTGVGGAGMNYTSLDAASGKTRLTVTLPCANPADSIYFYCYISNSSGGTLPLAGDWVAVDGVIAEVGPTYNGYFTGSTTDKPDVDYAWTGTANASKSTETTHVTQVTASTTLVLDKPWLMVPVMPNYALQAEAITSYGSDRQSRSTIHAVIGRADPLVSFGPLGTRTGSLEIFCNSLQAARDLETVFSRDEVVMLKQNVEAMDMYFLGSSTGISPYSEQGETATRYALTVNYTEINRPIAPLAGALGWDLNAVAAAYASYYVLTSKFATFDDLTVRNEK